MALKRLNDVDDGIITGTIETKGGNCYNCGASTRVIKLQALNLPKELYSPNPGRSENLFLKRLIFCDENGSMIDRIGVGCGCYAKGHRQIAHIKDRMKS